MVIVGVLVALLIAAIAITAGPIMDARAAAALACASGSGTGKISVHVDDPVPALDLVTGRIHRATVALRRNDATTTLMLQDIDLKTKKVANATATVTTPWSTVAKQASALPAGATLSSDGPMIAVRMASRPGVALLLRLTHTSTTLTIQGTQVKIGGATYPLTGALGNLPALQGLTEKHTLHPALPTGARIIDATSTDDGLRTRLSIDTAHLSSLAGTGKKSQHSCD